MRKEARDRNKPVSALICRDFPVTRFHGKNRKQASSDGDKQERTQSRQTTESFLDTLASASGDLQLN